MIHWFRGNCAAIERETRAAASYSKGPSSTGEPRSATKTSVMKQLKALGSQVWNRTGATAASFTNPYANRMAAAPTSITADSFQEMIRATKAAQAERNQ